ncbi:hypothetical protein JHK87_022022 [Glycine soja]|nr:hypothetical protein JHK87_022022 [Glycine soja]
MAMMAATTLTVTPPRWSWRPTRRSFSRQMHPRLREMVVSLGAIGLLKSFRVVKRHSWMSRMWKKIEDIPQQRRHRLLRLLKPRTNVNFLDQFLQKGKFTISFLLFALVQLIHFEELTPLLLFKAIFTSKDGQAYRRFISGSVLAAFANSFAPLYFAVRKLKEVMSTEQPCDLAYEFGDGLHDIKELPLGFPRPVKHPYPFNDQIVVYVRYLGPGVSVGQAWQEGTKLEQVPHKLYGEILMVKDCTSLREDQ